MHCSGSACSDCTEDSGSSTLILFKNLLVFYFPFFQFPAIISSFFPELGYFSGNYWSVALFSVSQPGYDQANIFKLTGMVYYNRSSLMILVSDAKYIHFLPIFPTSSNPFTLHVKSFIKWIEFYLFCYLFSLVKIFSATEKSVYHTIWISICNISKFKNFWSGLFIYRHCNCLVSFEWEWKIARNFCVSSDSRAF